MYCKYDTPEMVEAVFESVVTEEIENLRFYIMDGADPDLRNKGGLTLLHLAAKEGRTEAARLLLDMGADADAKTETTGHTALHYAAHTKNPGMIALLAARGATVDAEDQFKWTPLHMAAEHGVPEAAEALLEAGADPAKRNERGQTPYEIAKHKFETLKTPAYGATLRRLAIANEILNADSIRKGRLENDLAALRANRPQKRLGPGR
jgi:ankyrin repeat protein